MIQMLVLCIFLPFITFDKVRIRGEVEDTRLEAKAKTSSHTKKIRGQGHGQPLSKPRIGMLEAKAKDQEQKQKCYQKKKVLRKKFLAISRKTVFQKIFQALHKLLTTQKIVSKSAN